MRTIFMFSGQGSHYYGMGRDLFATRPVFRQSLLRMDDMFRDLGAPSIVGEIYRADRTAADPFDRLGFTHPAIFMLELALLETLRSEGMEPDCVLGASLGELAAAVAAGALRVDEVAECLIRQVELVEAHCSPGGMLAVLANLQSLGGEGLFGDNSELAGINTDSNFVMAGTPDGLQRIADRLNAANVLNQRLPVAYAFHSRWMDPAAEPCLRQLAATLSTRRPALPFLSCETADFVANIEPDHFWNLVRRPIRFQETIRKLEDTAEGWRYVDLGPSGTLASFARRNLQPGSRSECLAVLNPLAPGGNGIEHAKQTHEKDRHAHRSHPIKRRKNMKAYLFPGQGSQSRGMGAELFDEFPDLTARADQHLGYSIARLCREDPQRQLDQTQFTQPALFVVNALSYLRTLKAGHEDIAFVAGHSLGEYSALFASGAFDFETGLRLVQERAALMAQAKDGGMAAVIGLEEDAVRRVIASEGFDRIDIANYNGAKQLILAGPLALVSAAGPAFTAAGAQAYVPLRVSGAFHSRYMEPARREFERFLSKFAFKPLRVPVIANVTGEPYEAGAIARMLADQLTHPVRWDRTVRFLLRQEDIEIEELGPGKVLSKLVAKIREEAPARSTLAPPRSAPVPAETQPGISARRSEPSPIAAKSPHSHAPLAAPPRDTIIRPAAAGARVAPGRFSSGTLGSAAFRSTYGVRYAYVCGGMYRGIASAALVVRAARGGLLAFFGSGGLELTRVEEAIRQIQSELHDGEPYGMNLVHNPALSSTEEGTVDLFLKYGIRNVEAAAFMQITPALVRYRLKGLRRTADGGVEVRQRLMAKVSRPEVAEAFLAPAPERIVRRLEQEGQLTADEARLSAEVPMADDVCVEADSGGHTDQGNPVVLLPTIFRLRDRAMDTHRYRTRIRMGAAGGIGTPEAAAAAFILGADFILTGSINQCTVESGMSGAVKDMLEQINIQDTDYAPAGDMFELGAQVQVMKKGLFFPARAKKLYELYRKHESLDEIDASTRAQIEERYFRKSFEEVYRETRAYFMGKDPREVERADQHAKHKMALVFRWYFGHSQRLAMEGKEGSRVDFQVHCGPALGAFNQWVKGTPLESWRHRHVDEIAAKLMDGAADHLNRRLPELAA